MATSSKGKGDAQADMPAWASDGTTDDAKGGVTAEVIQAEIIPSTGEMIPLGPASTKVIQYCADHVSVGDADTAAAMEDMIRQVMASATPDEVLADQMTVPAQDILGKTIQVSGVRFGETEFAEGFPYYVLFDCSYGTPMRSHVVTCGAFKVVAQAVAMDMIGDWPQVLMFSQADKPTRSGYRPISLRRPV